jgi:hypothetical protein
MLGGVQSVDSQAMLDGTVVVVSVGSGVLRYKSWLEHF